MTSTPSSNSAANPYAIPKIHKAFSFKLALPGSKSIALRQLAIAALTDGVTTLSGVPECDDTAAMLDCLRALGVRINLSEEIITLSGPMDLDGDATLNARMSGASTRLLIGLAACRRGQTYIDGHDSLRVRTNLPLYDVLRKNGCQIESQGNGLPVTIKGPMSGSAFRVDGAISSQYLTALLIAAPLISPQGLTVSIAGDLVSRPYIEITLNEMRKRGVTATWLDDHSLQVIPGSYQPGNAIVEGDATAASYFLGLATLHGSQIELTNLGTDTKQGDYAFTGLMESLGATVERHPDRTIISGADTLTSLSSVDMTEMPDAALTLIGMAPLIPGDTEITGLSTLRHKECDRLECPAKEMRAWGLAVETADSSIVIPAHASGRPTGAHVLNTYHDHRMAMAFSMLGSAVDDHATLFVDDKNVVAKTYPNYWQDYAKALG